MVHHKYLASLFYLWAGIWTLCRARSQSYVTTRVEATTLDLATCCNSTQEATAFALIYGYPLASYVQLSRPYLQQDGPNGVNVPHNQFQLGSPSDKGINTQNSDTLYTYVVYDVSHGDLVLTVPQIPLSRFWVFPAYDPYGDNFANIGSVDKSPAGNYLIRYYSDDSECPPGLELTPAGPYAGVITSPTAYGAFQIRILTIAGNQSDITIVNQYQKKIMITTVNPEAKGIPSLYDISRTVTEKGLSLSDPAASLQYLAAVAPYNHPVNPNTRKTVANILRTAGIHKSKYQQPAGVNLDHALRVANITVEASTQVKGNHQDVGKGWSLLFPKFFATYGRHYAARAVIAELGYLGLVPQYEAYPIRLEAKISEKPLPKNKALLFTFTDKPPLLNDGWWSLTAYNAQNFLIPNKLKRYALGNRSNLTYADGKPVYGSSSTAQQTGFQILLQAADVSPPSNWTNNWLPGPAGGGLVPYNLRWGAASPALLDGSYTYPSVQIIDAIRSDAS